MISSHTTLPEVHGHAPAQAEPSLPQKRSAHVSVRGRFGRVTHARKTISGPLSGPVVNIGDLGHMQPSGKLERRPTGRRAPPPGGLLAPPATQARARWAQRWAALRTVTDGLPPLEAGPGGGGGGGEALLQREVHEQLGETRRWGRARAHTAEGRTWHLEQKKALAQEMAGQRGRDLSLALLEEAAEEAGREEIAGRVQGQQLLVEQLGRDVVAEKLKVQERDAELAKWNKFSRDLLRDVDAGQYTAGGGHARAIVRHSIRKLVYEHRKLEREMLELRKGRFIESDVTPSDEVLAALQKEVQDTRREMEECKRYNRYNLFIEPTTQEIKAMRDEVVRLTRKLEERRIVYRSHSVSS